MNQNYRITMTPGNLDSPGASGQLLDYLEPKTSTPKPASSSDGEGKSIFSGGFSGKTFAEQFMKTKSLPLNSSPVASPIKESPLKKSHTPRPGNTGGGKGGGVGTGEDGLKILKVYSLNNGDSSEESGGEAGEGTTLTNTSDIPNNKKYEKNNEKESSSSKDSSSSASTTAQTICEGNNNEKDKEKHKSKNKKKKKKKSKEKEKNSTSHDEIESGSEKSKIPKKARDLSKLVAFHEIDKSPAKAQKRIAEEELKQISSPKKPKIGPLSFMRKVEESKLSKKDKNSISKPNKPIRVVEVKVKNDFRNVPTSSSSSSKDSKQPSPEKLVKSPKKTSPVAVSVVAKKSSPKTALINKNRKLSDEVEKQRKAAPRGMKTVPLIPVSVSVSKSKRGRPPKSEKVEKEKEPIPMKSNAKSKPQAAKSKAPSKTKSKAETEPEIEIEPKKAIKSERIQSKIQKILSLSDSSVAEKKGSSTSTSKTDSKNHTIDCICGNNDKKAKVYIKCTTCSIWYHGECIDVTEADYKKKKYYVCDECEKKGKTVELFCICQTPDDPAKFYLQCFRCAEWFHCDCINVTAKYHPGGKNGEDYTYFDEEGNRIHWYECTSCKSSKCVCDQPYHKANTYVFCESSCKMWYHCKCIGLLQIEAKEIKEYKCLKCDPTSSLNKANYKILSEQDYALLSAILKEVKEQNFLSTPLFMVISEGDWKGNTPFEIIEKNVEEKGYIYLKDFVGDFAKTVDYYQYENKTNLFSILEKLQVFLLDKLKDCRVKLLENLAKFDGEPGELPL